MFLNNWSITLEKVACKYIGEYSRGRKRRKGEHEESEDEKNVVEGREAAEDLNQGLLQLDLSVVEHQDGHQVPQDPEEGDHGDDPALHPVLEGHRVQHLLGSPQ